MEGGLGQKLILGRQIHADIYRALQCIEENELEGEDQGRLLEVSSRASALILILEELERLAVKRVRQMSEGVDPGPGYVDL
jgi:hypothetical protein